MLVKVLCPCGTKFAFEVEPVNGRMPMEVQCPSCNTDSTMLANAAIAGQLAADTTTAPAAPEPPPGSAEPPKVRIRMSAAPAASSPPPAPPAEEPSRARLRTASALQPAAPATPPDRVPAPEARPAFCARQKTDHAVETCRVCGKPICPKCMELYGYVCSVFCRTKAEAEGIVLPRYAKQRNLIEAGVRSKGRLVGVAITAGVALLFATWIWWAFFGTKPAVMFSLQVPKAERGTVYEMLSQTEILVLKENQLALLYVANGGKEVWSTPLETAKTVRAVEPPALKKSAPKESTGPTAETAAGKLAADAAKAATKQAPADDPDDEEDFDFSFYGAPALLTLSDDIWLKFPDRIASYDRKTGARKQDIPFKQPLFNVTHSSSSIVAVSGDPLSVRTLTLISLPAGSTKTLQIQPSPNAAAILARATKNTGGFAPASDDDNDTRLEPVVMRDDFLPAGDSVVEYKTKMLEHKTITRQAMKPKSKDGGIMESGRLSAGQSLDAAVELLNDMGRQATGGVVQEDVSRYQVTLQRLLGNDAAPWIGEVIGPPAFYPLKTVDVVFGAKDVIVLDKSNKKRWEAKLTYNMGRAAALGMKDEEHFPCAQTADALYVFDEGMLTCFELATGQARWRLTSVGVSRVQFDSKGKLYVNTTTASPDVIDYPQQLNIKDRPQPVIMKVDPSNGKVLWKVTSHGDECILTGKFVYLAWSSSGLGASGSYFNLYRVNPSNGREEWHYYQERWPRNTGYQGNCFMLQWKDELQVLKFLTL